MTHEEYIVQALDALQYSYSPYSHFRVGACLVCEDGKTYKGANFENASYGATICAERCAASNAIVDGNRRFTCLRRLEKKLAGSGNYELVNTDQLVLTAGTYQFPGDAPYEEKSRDYRGEKP